MELATLPATAFKSPAISLTGVVDYTMYTNFRSQFDNASEKDLVVIEMSTLGGDPEVARWARMFVSRARWNRNGGSSFSERPSSILPALRS
ncbi:hypothetical protein [Bradyrhizobium genosp. P]|uniref:hypothetical protein n=1 Tax=Bradyrhizobium genosp. P TaxID=83641 RepID=UPI003CEBAB19